VIVPLLILLRSKEAFPDIWLTPTRKGSHPDKLVK
jgi:hypothetical protein